MTITSCASHAHTTLLPRTPLWLERNTHLLNEANEKTVRVLRRVTSSCTNLAQAGHFLPAMSAAPPVSSAKTSPQSEEPPPVSSRNNSPEDKRKPPSLQFGPIAVDRDGRRLSVQFVSHPRAKGSPRPAHHSRSVSRGGMQTRRMSSPPPPPSFTPRVAFDTFDNRDASELSFTISKKHKDYEYTKRSRTFLCGTDTNEHSEFALEWLIDELVDDGDEIVCLRVMEKDSKFVTDSAVEQGRYRVEAERMMELIQSKNQDNKAINLVLEISVGKIQDTIQQKIKIYEPAILVVGTRGRSLGGFQGLLPGSVSKYCLQHSPVPVIVVRPSAKRDKKKRKRQLDPGRHAYRDILDKSDDVSHLVDMVVGGEMGSNMNWGETADAETEAKAVADAIGYQPRTEDELIASKHEEHDEEPEAQITITSASDSQPGTPLRTMKDLRHVPSPGTSDASEGDEEHLRGAGEDEDEEDEPIVNRFGGAVDELDSKRRKASYDSSMEENSKLNEDDEGSEAEEE